MDLVCNSCLKTGRGLRENDNNSIIGNENNNKEKKPKEIQVGIKTK